MSYGKQKAEQENGNEKWVGSGELGCSINTVVRKGGVEGRIAPKGVMP